MISTTMEFAIAIRAGHPCKNEGFSLGSCDSIAFRSAYDLFIRETRYFLTLQEPSID